MTKEHNRPDEKAHPDHGRHKKDGQAPQQGKTKFAAFTGILPTILIPEMLDPEKFGIKLMELTDEEFKLISQLVYAKFGIHLTEAKRSLVIGRLQKTLRQMGFSTFREFYDYLMADTTGEALDALANQISTNHTFFYREKAHFTFFRQTALPQITQRLRAENRRDMRLWCAGCSSGEEAYTLVLEMMEFFGHEYSLWDAGLLATDISAKALRKAMAGMYLPDNVHNVPPYGKHHFTKKHDGSWEIAPAVKKEVTFRRFNLMNATFPFRKPFHVIFCRNVMIYFDQKTRSDLIRKFHSHLEPGGYLFIGHSESLGREQELFEYIMPAVYRRR